MILHTPYFQRLFCQYASLSHLTPLPLPSCHNPEAVCTAAPRNAGHRSRVKSQSRLGGLALACSGRGAAQQERAQGRLRPRHGPAVAVDTSVLQLLHSQDPGKLLPKDRQGLLLSCQKNVTRKQHTPSPVIFSSHLFSFISQSPSKSLPKSPVTTVGQLTKCQHL